LEVVLGDSEIAGGQKSRVCEGFFFGRKLNVLTPTAAMPAVVIVVGTLSALGLRVKTLDRSLYDGGTVRWGIVVELRLPPNAGLVPVPLVTYFCVFFIHS
jgi:hypothetical protein